jgi:hypothetical protein
MALDGGFHIFCKVCVDDSRGVFRKQCDAPGDCAAYRLGGMNNRDRTRAILYDDFCPCAHVGQERFDVGRGGFFFREVNDVLGHEAIIHRDTEGKCKVRQVEGVRDTCG